MMPFGNAVGEGFVNPVVNKITVVELAPGDGIFIYSPSQAAGNLVLSMTEPGGTDEFGNNFLSGFCTYSNSGGFATQLDTGVVQFYKGSLSIGWTLVSQIIIDNVGDMSITAGGLLSLFANGGTIDLQSGSIPQPHPASSFAGIIAAGQAAGIWL